MPTDREHATYPPLTAMIAPWMQRVLGNPSFLEDLFHRYGSPINVIHTDPFAANHELFENVFQKHRLKHKVIFARKANPCKVFVQESHRLGFGVDTASYVELKQCLEMGCDPNNLVLTGAIKDDRLMHLALEHDALMILDNEDECRSANSIAALLGKTAKVGVRVSGFRHKGEKLYSRFGFDVDYVTDFISSRIGRGMEYGNLRFDGFHFHLSGYSVEQRSEALFQSVQLSDTLLTRGIQTSFIDMGGGVLVNYLASPSEWDTFWSELKKAVLFQRRPLTFDSTGLGYELINGELHGEPDVYPYYSELSKDAFLDAVLSYPNPQKETPASLLRDRGIEVRMEPGRSLLDQAGFTMAKVVHRKRDSQGNWLIGLGMNQSQLGSSSADFLVDPVFIQKEMNRREMASTPVFFTGGYCLEQDIILKRTIVLPCLPEIGDIVCFVNTAGYMMHFCETRSHLFEFATNVVMDRDPDTLAAHRDRL